jgi:phosphate uptake regulator
MQRKLIRHGPSSLVTSLPSKWIKENNLKKGDIIELSEQKNNIVLKPTLSKEKKKSINIEIDNLDRSTFLKYLIAAYIKGYHEIIISFKEGNIIDYKINKKVPVSKVVRIYLPRFIGMEIVSQNRKDIILKEVSRSTDEDFKVIFRRIIYLMNAFSREIKSSLSLKNKLSSEEAYERHDNIVKLIYYILRILNKKNFLSDDEKADFYYAINLFDEITDYLRYCVNDLNNIPKITPTSNIIIKDILTLFEGVNNNFFAFDLEEIKKFTKKRFVIKKKIMNLKGQDAILITRFSTILDLTQFLVRINCSMNLENLNRASQG